MLVHTGKSAHRDPETLTVRDLRALADRLHTRGHSLVFADQPYLQADLKLAGDVIRTLVSGQAPDDTLVLGRRRRDEGRGS
jgi:hypothetical protein